MAIGKKLPTIQQTKYVVTSHENPVVCSQVRQSLTLAYKKRERNVKIKNIIFFIFCNNFYFTLVSFLVTLL